MLVLRRKEGEILRIGHDIKLVVMSVTPSKVVVGIEAPDSVVVLRQEVYEAIKAGKEAKP